MDEFHKRDVLTEKWDIKECILLIHYECCALTHSKPQTSKTNLKCEQSGEWLTPVGRKGTEEEGAQQLGLEGPSDVSVDMRDSYTSVFIL